MSDKIKYGIQTAAPNAATGLLKTAYSQMNHDLTGVHEPFLVHSPAQDVLLGLWSAYRESLLASGLVSRALKETVTVTISKINQCPWCFEAHQISLYAVGASNTVAALAHNRSGLHLDERTTSLIEWAQATLTPQADILQNPPFSPAEAPEIIGTALVYHYITRMVNALLVESALPAQSWLKEPLKRIFGMIFRPFARQNIPQGETLILLPEVPLPADLAWANGSPAIAAAFARFAAAVESACQRTVPEPLREFVQAYLDSWHGEDRGISRRWVDDAVKPLHPDFQALGKLMLLGAIAPYQIDEGVVADFCRLLPGDRALIEALAWASFAAARRIGSWLVPMSWPVSSGSAAAAG